MSIDGTDDSNITVTAAGKDLDIAVAGGSTQELRLASAGTGASAMHLNASAGGINIDSADMLDIDAADEITIDTTSADGHIAVTSAHTAGQAILISANADAGSILDIDAGILDIDVQAAATIDAVGVAIGAGSGELDLTTTGLLDINANALDMDLTDSSNITITSSEAAEDLTIAQVGANDSSILVTAAGTGADAVSVDVTAGSMLIAPSLVDNKTLTVGNTSSTHMLFSPDDTAGDEKILIKNAAGTADSAIKLWSAAGGITLLAANDSLHIDADGTDADAINIDSAGGIDVDAAGAISLDSSAGSIDINVVDGQTVNIGLNGGVEQIIAPHGTAGSELYSVINTAGTTDGTDAAGAILLSSVAGGIGLAWADGKDLWAEGGRAVVTANEDAADCIKLHADAGTSQTITVVNDAGTSVTEGSAAVSVQSLAGGVELRSTADLANAVNITNDGGASGTITIFNDQGTSVTEGAASIQLLTDAGGIGIKSTANLANAVLITADGGADETIVIHSDQGTGEGNANASIELVSDAGGICLTATGLTGVMTDTNSDAAIQLHAAAGGLGLRTTSNLAGAIQIEADGGAAETIIVKADQSTVDGTAGAGAIALVSDAGGIGLSWADGKDLWAEGGRAVITANEDAADCIKLHADAGTSQTITIVNDAGTSASAIKIDAAAGSVDIDSANGTTITGGALSLGSAAGAAGSFTSVVSRVAGATDNTATAVFTVTVPNGAHTAGVFLKIVGAVSDNEGVKIGMSSVAISRISGAATAKTVFSFGGSASFTLDAAATGGAEAAANIAITCSGLTGAVDATQTFTINVTVDTAAGTTADIVAVAELVNNEASGITIAAV